MAPANRRPIAICRNGPLQATSAHPRRQPRRGRNDGQRADASAKPERMPGVTDAVICSLGANDSRWA